MAPLLLAHAAHAAEDGQWQTLPPPAMPEQAGMPEPEVVITPLEGERVKEYRINGMLYMIEINPAKGPPYYLLDSDGDGVLETRRHNVETDVSVPRWVIFRW